MGLIPDDTIQEIRDRIDLVDVVGRHITLRPSGRSFKGLCPFHDEKTPSFQVSRERQSFYCFGCGAHGDCFGFLMQHERLAFPEAVRTLAAELGIQVPEDDGGDAGRTRRLEAANRAALDWFRAQLGSPAGAGARDYLQGRGLTPELVEHFQVGFAPDAWDGLIGELRRLGIDPGLAKDAGLLAERRSGGHYDLLRGRVVFPIQDVRGRVVGFGGRALGDGQPKYLNTPETPLFRKRESFYGFPHALEPIRRNDRVVVVEGYFDCVALHRAGVDEAVATCGTALSDRHAVALRKRTRNVVLLFDGDDAGARAMERALELLLPEGLRVMAAVLPAGQDPDDLLRSEGPDALRALVDDARPALERVIERAAARGCATPWQKADAVNAVAPLLARIPDRVERFEFVRRLALVVDTDPQHAEQAVGAAARGSRAGEAPARVAAPRREPREEQHLRRVAGILLEHPGHWAHLPRDEFLDLIEGSEWRELIAALLDAAAGVEDGKLDVARVSERVSEASQARLRALAAGGDEEHDAQTAADILHDTLRGFRRQRQRREQRDATRRLRAAHGDEAQDLLAVKQRQLDERRRIAETP